MAKTVELTNEEVTFLHVYLSRHLITIDWFQIHDPVLSGSIKDAKRVMRDLLGKLKVAESEVNDDK